MATPEITPTGPTLSVVICTFERPKLLAAALASLFRLEGLERARLDVIVVDNSDGGSARATVAALAAAEAPVPVTYLAAHPANISVARNAGVAATEAEIVALLDDDQEVEPSWLAAVLDGVARFPHDVFFGPITPRFETDEPAGSGARVMFTRASDAEAGADVVAIGPGRRDFPVSTANAIFRRARTLTGPEPFDPRLGQAGGEDLHLFCRLQHAGRRFGWLPEAGASDAIPAHRCHFRYLLKRHFVGGQVYAAAVVWTSPTPRREAAWVLVRALAQLAVFPAAAAASFVAHRNAEALAFRLAGILGKIFWGRRVPLYRDEQRAVACAGETVRA